MATSIPLLKLECFHFSAPKHIGNYQNWRTTRLPNILSSHHPSFISFHFYWLGLLDTEQK